MLSRLVALLLTPLPVLPALRKLLLLPVSEFAERAGKSGACLSGGGRRRCVNLGVHGFVATVPSAVSDCGA